MTEGYSIIADFHTHTYFSHGMGSIEANVRAAIAKGFTRIAITDHGCSQPLMGLTGEKIVAMRRQVDRLSRKFGSAIEILLGVEANTISMDGRIDLPAKLTRLMDMITIGLHRLVLTTQREYFLRMNMGYLLRNRSDAHYERLREAATRAICAALDKNPIDVLTHMGHMFPVDEEEVIGACLRNDVVIEINASHRMPEPDVLRSALNRGCMFSIASDAHHPRDVGRMNWGLQTAAALGIPAQRIINTKEQADFLFKKARGKP